MNAFIFDVDGVLVDSPHEQAWREALRGLEGPSAADRLTPEVYQRLVSGRPRADGARAVLEHVGASPWLTEAYADSKQALMVELIDAGSFRAFPDAVRLVGDLRGAGVPIAAASSSKNAHRFLRALALEFEADVSGLDVPGKPDPAIFLAAADELDVPPWECVARAGDHDALRAAGADVVVSNLYAIQP